MTRMTGLSHREAMDVIFERFLRRSPEDGYSFAEFQRDALTILDAASQPETLDAAWKEAEAALPDDSLITSIRVLTDGSWTAGAVVVDRVEWGTGPTPAAALTALATRLKEGKE